MKRTALLLLLPALCLLAQKKGAEPPAASVTIQSDPAGATVLLDRVPVGVTPATLETAPGTRLLTLQKPGHADVFETISPMLGVPNIFNFTLEPLAAWVLLHSDPPGAEVFSDNISLGATPTLIKVATPSARLLQFTLAGHQSKTIQLDVKDQTPVLLNISLSSDTGTLLLTTTPPGARILVDGINRGVTPRTLDKLDSEVTLEISLDGYQPVTHKIRIAPGDTQSLELPLTPEPATLEVASIPNAARIYLNDAFQGEAPVKIENLPPGQYRVRAEKEGHDPDARTLPLGNGEKKSVEFRLRSNLGRLEITTEPAGVKIFIDGKEVGETVDDPGKSTQISLPRAIEDVAVGEREIRLVRQQFEEQREVVTIERGRTFTKHYKLVRRFIPDYEIKTVNNIFRGVYINRTGEATIIETAPGVMNTVRRVNIISEGFIRDRQNTP